MTRTIRAADLFCGAGGTSTGLARAAERLGSRLELLAVNHWQTAVETHAANHPWAEHACASLDSIDPRKAVRGRLDLLVASPECTHHSSARGGKPCSDQSRASAWHVVAWADQLRPRAILVENVREFATWGPLDVRGRPLRSRAGETYAAWIDALRSLGYRVEARLLNAADYGDATTRRRLFVVATLARRGPAFPDATHDKDGGGAQPLFGSLPRWRAAREVIDWSYPSRSIFDRERPLAPATLRRIEEGLRRFGGAAAEPFLAVLRGTATVRSVDVPVPALTAGGTHVGLVEPFTLSQQSGGIARRVSDPLQTVAAKGAVSLVQPFLVPHYSERPGQTPRVHGVDEPLPTVPATNQHALVQPFVVQVNHGENRNNGRGNGGRVRDLEQPLPTVCAGANGLGIAEPFIVPQNGQAPPRSVDRPLGVITTTSRGVGVVEPFMVRYHGTGGAESVDDPVPTLTARDRLGLAEPDGTRVDIRFRMLQPHELARAMSFPDDYRFAGNRGEVVRQIGNAVPVRIAEALCTEILERLVIGAA